MRSAGKPVPAMKAVAQEMDVPLLDIYSDTRDWLKSLGDEASKPYFMQLAPGECECYPEGRNDNTHTVYSGAVRVASFVVQRIRQTPQLKPLSRYILRKNASQPCPCLR